LFSPSSLGGSSHPSLPFREQAYGNDWLILLAITPQISCFIDGGQASAWNSTALSIVASPEPNPHELADKSKDKERKADLCVARFGKSGLNVKQPALLMLCLTGPIERC